MSFEQPKRGDEQLRSLERAWKESGSVEDKAKYLQGRLRAGELTKENIEMAAILGDKASMSVSGREIPDDYPLEDIYKVISDSGSQELQARVVLSIDLLDHIPKEYERTMKYLQLALLDPDQYKSKFINIIFENPGSAPGMAAEYVLNQRMMPDPRFGEPLNFFQDIQNRLASSDIEEGAIREAFREEVIPWLLGEYDKVAERVHLDEEDEW